MLYTMWLNWFQSFIFIAITTKRLVVRPENLLNFNNLIMAQFIAHDKLNGLPSIRSLYTCHVTFFMASRRPSKSLSLVAVIFILRKRAALAPTSIRDTVEKFYAQTEKFIAL
jgi:hypothetical protein